MNVLNINESKKILEQILKQKSKLIYIAGSSASWKSYFARNLVNLLKKRNKKVLEISSDNYYTDQTNLQFMLYGTFDHPKLIEYDVLQKNIHEYFKTNKVSIPKYSFVERRRVWYHEVQWKFDYVIVEWLYTIDQLSNEHNPYKIYVDSSIEEMIFRRIIRDQDRVRESIEWIIWMLWKVFPLRKIYWESQKKKSDLIVFNNYEIMLDKWQKYNFKSIKKIPNNVWKLKQKYHIIDYIYDDGHPGNGVIYVSEVYKDKQHLLDHIRMTKSKLDDHKSDNYTRIVIPLYAPGSLTMVHTLLQTAWLQFIGTSKKVEELYEDSKNKLTMIKKSRNKIYLIEKY